MTERRPLPPVRRVEIDREREREREREGTFANSRSANRYRSSVCTPRSTLLPRWVNSNYRRVRLVRYVALLNVKFATITFGGRLALFSRPFFLVRSALLHVCRANYTRSICTTAILSCADREEQISEGAPRMEAW